MYFTLDMHYKHLLEPPFSLSANYVTRLSHLINCNFEFFLRLSNLSINPIKHVLTTQILITNMYNVTQSFILLILDQICFRILRTHPICYIASFCIVIAPLQLLFFNIPLLTGKSFQLNSCIHSHTHQLLLLFKLSFHLFHL